MDKFGHLYGTTSGGGAGQGVAFELTPDASRTKWTETVLYSLCSKGFYCTDGGSPSNLIMRGGKLYGTTRTGGETPGAAAGTVFELVLDSPRKKWAEKVLYTFYDDVGFRHGSTPEAGLVMDASGDIFGTTHFGGARPSSAGTVFELKR